MTTDSTSTSTTPSTIDPQCKAAGVINSLLADTPAAPPESPAKGLDLRPFLVALDSRARARAAEAAPHVGVVLAESIERSHDAPLARQAADLGPVGYALTVAISTGLNHWIVGHVRRWPSALVFVPAKPGDEVELVPVMVDADTEARARELASALGVPLANVFSAAACSGVEVLLGSREIRGPFEGS